MSAPSIERTYPKFGDASTVVALIALREAWSQWRLKNGNDLVGSLDKRPLPVTLRPETEEEKATRASFVSYAGPTGRLIVHHGPADIYNLAGPLDLRPVIEEIEAFEAFRRSKRWATHDARQPGDRVVRVMAEHRGRECGAEHVIREQDFAKWRGSEARLVQFIVEIVDQRIDGLVMRRIAGSDLVAMIEGDR